MDKIETTRRAILKGLLSGCILSLLPAVTWAASSLITQFGPHFTKTPRRILSAGAPSDLLLLALAPEKLCGFAHLSLTDTPTLPFSHIVSQLPKLGRLAGRGSTLSLEKVMALAPEVIIDCGTVDDTYRSQAERVAQQTGIPYWLVEGKLSDAPQQLREVGARLGVSERAEAQAMLATRWLQEADSYAQHSKRHPSFYSARGVSGLETGLQGSLHTEAAELLGWQNVVHSAGRTGLTTVSMEQLLLWQPDLILTQDETTYRHILHSPLWQAVKAVSQQQVFCFSGLPFGWLDSPPGINRLLGLRRLQATQDPETARTLNADTRLLLRTVFHTELNESQCQALLEEKS